MSEIVNGRGASGCPTRKEDRVALLTHHDELLMTHPGDTWDVVSVESVKRVVHMVPNFALTQVANPKQAKEGHWSPDWIWKREMSVFYNLDRSASLTHERDHSCPFPAQAAAV
jgi:hypothetical protein